MSLCNAMFDRTSVLWAFALLLAIQVVRADGPVLTSPHDEREYVTFKMANGMTVLLISDPEAEQSAAALDVMVGAANNPPDRPGLAHFLEHALYLGTKKYPKPGAYEQFISDHGGRENAYTAFDHTNYYFTVNSPYLEPALDRFSELFVAPLFDADFLERERSVVDAEFKSKLRDDSRRIRYAQKEMFNPEHPFSRLSTGNQQTLAAADNAHLRDEIVRFHASHYSSHLMSLVVLGREPIPVLRGWVENKFAAVPAGPEVPVSIKQPLFIPDTLPARINVEPQKDLRFLLLTFPIPSLVEHYRTKPARFIASLLGHKGDGQLVRALKQRGWASNVSVEANDTRRQATTFNISVSLTQRGLARVNDITALVFRYISLARQSGTTRWRFDELAQIAASDFRFMRRTSVAKYVKSLAHHLQLYPAQHVVRGAHVMDRFDPAVIKRYLGFLRPDNVLVTVVGKGMHTDLTASWYNTRYGVVPLRPDQPLRWRSRAPRIALSLPKPNAFVATNLDLKPLDAVSSEPVLLREREGFSAWHQQDETFRTPRADFFFSVNSEQATRSPKNALLTKLYVALVNQQLQPYVYPASLAGLSFKIQAHSRGFSVYLSGYYDKQTLLLERVLETLKSPKIVDQEFAQRKETLRRALVSSKHDRPYRQTVLEIRRLLLTPYWTEDELSEAIATISVDDLRAFVPQLLSRISATALSHGNLQRAHSLNAFDLLEQALVEPAEPVDVPHRQVIALRGGTDYVRDIEIKHPDAALTVYYQGERHDEVSKAEFALIAQVLKPHFYRELRTKKKLGYHVFANYLEMLDTPGVAFVVQAPEASVTALQHHIEDFVREYFTVISGMSDEAFERQRRAVITKTFEKDEHLRARSRRYWNNLSAGHRHFNTRERFASAVESISKRGFIEAYKRILLSEQRNRLVVRSLDSSNATASEQLDDVPFTSIPHTNFFRQPQATLPVTDDSTKG